MSGCQGSRVQGEVKAGRNVSWDSPKQPKIGPTALNLTHSELGISSPHSLLGVSRVYRI